jgi:CheY-like chemotaxis protein
LRELGYTVLEAEDGPSALRQLEKNGKIDLVFTDIGLPGMNGRQFIDEARKLRPTIRVLYTTAYAQNAVVHHGRIDPGVQLLSKPFNHADLANKVRSVLDAEASPRIDTG